MGPFQANIQLQDAQSILGAVPDASDVTVMDAGRIAAVVSAPVAILDPNSATDAAVAANTPAPVQVPDSVAAVQDAPPAIA